MTVVDIIIAVLLLLALYKGVRDGLIKQVLGIAAVIIGIILAGRVSGTLATWLHQWIEASEKVVTTISFGLIIIATLIVVGLISSLLEKILNLATLGWINRLLGGVISIASCVLVIGALISLITYINQTLFTLIPDHVLHTSKMVGIIQEISGALFPYLEKLFEVVSKA